jgi:hypothetical protein
MTTNTTQMKHAELNTRANRLAHAWSEMDSRHSSEKNPAELAALGMDFQVALRSLRRFEEQNQIDNG